MFRSLSEFSGLAGKRANYSPGWFALFLPILDAFVRKMLEGFGPKKSSKVSLRSPAISTSENS